MPDNSMADDAKGQQKTKVEQLREKRDKLNSQIRQLEAHEVNKRRRQENRRKVLIGSAILARVKNRKEGWDEDRLLAMMDNFLDRPKERELFGLDPLPASSPRLHKAEPQKSKSDSHTGQKRHSVTSDSTGISDAAATEAEKLSEKTTHKSLTEVSSEFDSDSEAGITHHDFWQNTEHTAAIAGHVLSGGQIQADTRLSDSGDSVRSEAKRYRPKPAKRLPESDDDDELEKEFNL